MVNQAATAQAYDGFTDVHEVESRPEAEGLVGLVVSNRWRLERLMHISLPETGGNFGVGYVARDMDVGLERFVKVVDYQRGINDPFRLANFLKEAEFEVIAHKACLRMSKVVRMVDHGKLVFRTTSDDSLYTYLCLVQEKGEGDIKSHVDYSPERSPAWKLWVLREVALAARQMELAHLAHNDIKPSNVIRFASNGSREPVKLGDIGRIVTRDGRGPFDGKAWAGDPAHQPIEAEYGWQEPEWSDRCTAADAYMVGNLICFLFTGSSLTERIINSMPEEYRPGRLPYRDALDLVRHTWNAVLTDQVMPSVPAAIRDKLGSIIRWLTDPDPTVRGEPAARRAGTIGLDRIASHLERLALQAQVDERLKKKAS
jgi:serine/threonine protein kinase